MFTKCDFLLGQNESIVIVIPAHLPQRRNLHRLGQRPRYPLQGRARRSSARSAYPGGEVFRRIANNVQIGIVEHEVPDDFPGGITNVAYVEVAELS